MNKQTEATSLPEGLRDEMRRCRELLTQYQEIGSAGAFGASCIQTVITQAEDAQASGDVVYMLLAYEHLKECS